MNRKVILSLFSLVTASILYSCVPDVNSTDTTPETDMEKLNVPTNFNFNTSQDVSFSLGAFDNADAPISGVIMSVYSYPDDSLLFKGITTDDGKLVMTQKIPTFVNKVTIRPDYIGLPYEYVVDVSSNVEVSFGGKTPTLKENAVISAKAASSLKVDATTAQTYPSMNYLGNFTSSGVPRYLEKDRDVISKTFLEYINASVPESKSVPKFHPDYLNSNNRNFLYIKELSDVYITFVHEGAGWVNTLCFYTFDPLNPPKTTTDISKMTVIFPNVSYQGSGGGLISGDKVKIGRFPAGTGIGFALLGNSWIASNSTVGKGYYANFSHDDLNVEVDKTLRRHLIALNDPTSKRMLLAYEDVSREASSDNDFNDAIFYATSNPVQAIDTDNVPIVDSPKDTDGDGVGDTRDEYPTDPTRAINSYVPGKNSYNTLAYEDLWPIQGDYDLNDLVINYQFQEVLNAKNQVVDLKAKFYVKAIGANYTNGWGFQLPIDPSLVKSVTGNSLTEGVIKTNANGTEASQKYANFIVFDNAFKQMKSSGGFINTTQGSSLVAPKDTIRLTINFSTPINKSSFGTAPYNPYLFKSNERGKEVHLPNQVPTSKATLSLLGTGQDASSITKNIYYKTAKGLPWAVDFSSDFKYPLETVPIINAYNKFADWAESGGTLYPDWYLQSKGYFDSTKLYQGK